MSLAPFFTTTRKRPFVRSTETSLSKWLAREVTIRRDRVENDNDEISEKAWNEIGALASTRFGDKVNVDELKGIWAKEGAEHPESPGSVKGRNSPSTGELLLIEPKDDDYDGPKVRKESPLAAIYGNRTPIPSKVYKVVVREVLRRSSMLIDKCNAKSRTPQANHGRWTAWQEIRQAVIDECGRVFPPEQIQIMWRHQKQKVDAELIEEAIVDPTVVDEEKIEKLFKAYEEKNEQRKETDIADVLKDLIGENGLGHKNADDQAVLSLPSTPVSASTFLLVGQNGLPVPMITTQSILANPMQLVGEHPVTSTTSIDDSINAVVRCAAGEDRRTSLAEKLVQAQIRYFEESSEIHKRQLEVMENFTKTVQKLLEK